MTIKKHAVVFHSPGTLFDEVTEREIPEWHPPFGARLAREVSERYGAKPYGFRFVTRIVAEPVPDGEGGTLRVEAKEIARSGVHFIAGKVLRFDDIPDDRENSILRGNMRSNGWPLVAETRNSYRSVQPFTDADVIVDADGNTTERGDAPRHVEYRALMTATWATPS